MTDQNTQATEAKQNALALYEQARAMVIKNDDDYVAAGEALVRVKRGAKKVNEVFDPIVKSNYDAWKTAVAQKKKVLEPLEKAKAVIGPLMAQYQEAKETERRRTEAQAEEEARIDAAAGAERNGDTEEAEDILNGNTFVPPAIPQQEAPKVAGTAIRKNWTFSIVDANKIPREFLTPDIKKIGQYVRAMKENAKIDGVRIYYTSKAV